MNNSQSILKRALLFGGALIVVTMQYAHATGFAWIEDAAQLERETLTLTAGGAFYSSAPFPYAGLDGDLYEVPWVGLRYSASETAQFYFSGALRKLLTVDVVDSAEGSSELQQPVALRQSRSATGDFSVYSKLRFPLFNHKLDLGVVTGFTMPNTNTGSGLGLDRGAIHGRVLLGYSFHGIRLIANTGIAIINNTTGPGQDDFFTYGIGAVIAPTNNLEIHGELYGIDGPPDGASDGLFDSLNVAIGVSANSDKYAIDLTVKGFLKEPSPSTAVILRFSRTFHLGRK